MAVHFQRTGVVQCAVQDANSSFYFSLLFHLFRYTLISFTLFFYLEIILRIIIDNFFSSLHWSKLRINFKTYFNIFILFSFLNIFSI